MSTKKMVYLHIGTHKTGTSAIFQFLTKNRNKLSTNHDCCFFEPSPWPLKMSKNKLKFSVLTKGFGQLKQIEPSKIVITHENYSWLNDAKDWTKIKKEIDKNDCESKVVLYLRRQDSLAVSQKQEGTKWIDNSLAYGHDLEPLPSYSSLTNEARLYLDYLTRYRTLVSVFGKDNVIVRVFEKDKLLNKDIVTDFCSVIGIKDLSGFSLPGRVNESISAICQIFLHKTRKYFPEHSLAKRILTQTAVRQDKGKDKHLPSKQVAKDFYSNYAESNVTLSKEVFGVDKDLFADKWDMYPDSIVREDISVDELSKVYANVITDISEELEMWRNKFKSQDKGADESLLDDLRKLAISFEKQGDYNNALRTMKIALKVRPDGPFIKRKIEEYKGNLNEKDI